MLDHLGPLVDHLCYFGSLRVIFSSLRHVFGAQVGAKLEPFWFIFRVQNTTLDATAFGSYFGSVLDSLQTSKIELPCKREFDFQG